MQEFVDITNREGELSWDDVIQKDSAGFALLPAGTYKFTVTKMERARHAGSAKLPPCNKAELTLTIDGGEHGAVSITHNLFLHTKCEGLLCAFFESIGQRKHGDPLVPKWNAIVGSSGMCELEVHRYTKKDGTDGESNQVKNFLPPEEPTLAEQQKMGGQGAF
ncbi:MAG: DUF669 domain-containing protein [Clostridiales bacterium]|nr:DUF669 domain-containing protein [Clostridiales bacterium]